MDWKDRIEALRAELVGKKVRWEEGIYTITAVDYNGIVHIDKPSFYSETTAVYEPCDARKNLV